MIPNTPRILHFILGLCFLLSPLPLLAEPEKTEKAVRVGYYEDGDYMRRTPGGEYVGFNFEYLQEIAKFSGLTYRVVDGVSWENTLAMLEKGEIDLLPAVYYTPERAKKMLFSELPMLNLYTTLNVRADDGRYSYEDFDSFQGMRVGIIAGSKDGEKFRRYCRDNNLNLIIVPYAETADLLAALGNKTLDGVAITHLGRNSVFRSVAQFSPEPMLHRRGQGPAGTADPRQQGHECHRPARPLLRPAPAHRVFFGQCGAETCFYRTGRSLYRPEKTDQGRL